MRNVTKTIKLTADVTVTVELITQESIGKEEWSGNEILKSCCDIHVRAFNKGKDVGGYGSFSKASHPKCADVTHRIGDLYLRSEKAKKVALAIDEIKSMPYVIEWDAKVGAAEKELDAYESHHSRVDSMMRMGE